MSDHEQRSPAAQALCDLVKRQADNIAALDAENMRLRAAIVHGAVYLEALHSDLIANDADMMIDTPVSPGAVASDLRTALKPES